jgi:hypothetical protein
VADAFECGSDPSGSVNAGSLLTNWGPVNFSEKTLLNREIDRQTEIMNKAVSSIYRRQDLSLLDSQNSHSAPFIYTPMLTYIHMCVNT